MNPVILIRWVIKGPRLLIHWVIKGPRVLIHWVMKGPRAHLTFLGNLSGKKFVLAVGLWVAVLKTAVAPLAGKLNESVFVPIGLTNLNLYTSDPLLKVSDYLTKTMYEGIPFPFLQHWNFLAVVSQLLLVALLFPIVATFLSQLVPLHLLERIVQGEKKRAIISVLTMGLLYLIVFGKLGLFLSGAVIAIPLVCAFFHRQRRGSLSDAYLVTSGAHMFANAVVIIFLGIFGEV